MAYTTSEKVKKRAKRALNPTDTDKLTAMGEIIDEGIEWGQSRIDSRLAERYPVPFDGTVPKVIQAICSDFAAYFTLRELFGGGAENKSPTLAREMLDEAEKWLEDLATGKASIPDLDDADTEAAAGILSSHSTPGPLAQFDLVNRPNITTAPFAPYR